MVSLEGSGDTRSVDTLGSYIVLIEETRLYTYGLLDMGGVYRKLRKLLHG